MTYEEAKKLPKDKEAVLPPVTHTPVILREKFNNGMVLEKLDDGSLFMSYAEFAKGMSMAIGKKYCHEFTVEKINGTFTQVLRLKDYVQAPVAKESENDDDVVAGDSWLTTEQVAESLGIKRQSVQVYLTRGVFPSARKIKGAYLIPQQDVEDYKKRIEKSKEELAIKRREPRTPRTVIARRELARQSIKHELELALNERLKKDEINATIKKALAMLEKL